MTYRAILGIDPGGTNGIALGFWDGNEYRFNTSSTKDRKELWELIKSPVELVIIEQFRASLISSHGLDTVLVIGGVLALCEIHGIPCIEDTPQQRKPYLKTAARLRDTGPGHTHHERDAMAHLVRYLYKQGHIKELD